MDDNELYEKLKKYVNEYPLKTGVYSGGPEGIPDIYKMPVIGYAVIQSTYRPQGPFRVVPVCPTGEDFNDEELTLLEGECFVSFIQATPKTLKVFGLIPDLQPEDLLDGRKDCGIETELLGYEFEGLPHLDWEATLRSRWIRYAWANRE